MLLMVSLARVPCECPLAACLAKCGLFCHSFTSQTMTCEGPRKTFTFATRTDVGWVWLPVLSLIS